MFGVDFVAPQILLTHCTLFKVMTVSIFSKSSKPLDFLSMISATPSESSNDKVSNIHYIHRNR